MIWEKAAPYDLSEIYNQMLLDVDPYMVYLKVLFELYGDDLISEDEESKRKTKYLSQHFKNMEEWQKEF